MTLQRLRQALCGLRGHDRLLLFEDQRLALKCVSCGHETPGFVLDAPPPTVTVPGDRYRHRSYLRLAARRIA